jgi:hypothetical protein
MDRQTIDHGSAVTPLARLAGDRGRPTIQVRRTGELVEAFHALASLGVRQLSYRFRFYDDGDVTWEFTSRRGASRDRSAWPAIKAARYRLGELLEAAIREAATEFLGFDHELLYECNAVFKPSTGSWQLDGRGTVYEIDPDVSYIGLALD